MGVDDEEVYGFFGVEMDDDENYFEDDEVIRHGEAEENNIERGLAVECGL